MTISSVPITDSSQPPTASDELLIQVQPDRAAAFDVLLLEREFAAFAAASPCVTKFKTEQGDDGGRYINLHMKTDDLAMLWEAVQAALYEHPTLGAPLLQSSMAICTGEAGWDDYLVLHHYDENVEVDGLDAS